MAGPSAESKSLLPLLSSLTYRKKLGKPLKNTENINSDNINLGSIQLQIFYLSDGVCVWFVQVSKVCICIYTLSDSTLIGQKNLAQQARIQAVSGQIQINKIGCLIFT